MVCLPKTRTKKPWVKLYTKSIDTNTPQIHIGCVQKQHTHLSGCQTKSRLAASQTDRTASYLAKHDFARAGIDNQLQGGSIDIEDHLAVGDAGDGQPKPEWPVGHFPEGLRTHTQVMLSRVLYIALTALGRGVGGGFASAQNLIRHDFDTALLNVQNYVMLYQTHAVLKQLSRYGLTRPCALHQSAREMD